MNSLYGKLYELCDEAILALDAHLESEDVSVAWVRAHINKLLNSIQESSSKLEVIDNPWAYTDTIVEDASTQAGAHIPQDFEATEIMSPPAQPAVNDQLDTIIEGDTESSSPSNNSSNDQQIDERFNDALMLLALRVESKLEDNKDLQSISDFLARSLLKLLIELCPELIAEKIQSAIEEQEPFKDVSLMNMGGMGWVFSATSTQDGQRRALKVPQKFVAKEIADLYEREMMFMATILENELDEEGYFVHFEEEGHLKVGSQEYSYAVLKYYPGPKRPIEAGPFKIESDQALSLAELIPVFKSLPPIMSALMIESTLLALIEIQEMGFIHGDLKPSNYLVRYRIAEQLWPMVGKDGPWSDELRLSIYRILMESKVRLITADFGAVREMESFLLGDEILDARTGEELVVQTPAYSNITGLMREGSKGQSDRHSIACILFELLTGEQARSHKYSGRYQSPWPEDSQDYSKSQRKLLDIALGVLNDPAEDQAHTDKGHEVKMTNALLQKIQLFIRVHEQEYKRSFLGTMKKGASKVWTRMGLSRKKLSDS